MRDGSRARERAAALGLLALAAVSFVLPFLSASAPGRRGDATGLQLVAGAPSYSGRYLHLAFQGEVESILAAGRLPARFAFAAAVLGLALGLISGRRPYVRVFVAASVGLLALVWFRAATDVTFSPPSSSLRYGFWVAASLLLAAGVYGFVLYRRERRRDEECDEEDVSPFTYERRRDEI
jgi:hypothetical protein